jgi:hypothetical protein
LSKGRGRQDESGRDLLPRGFGDDKGGGSRDEDKE